MIRLLIILFTILLSLLYFPIQLSAVSEPKEQSIIIEVEGDPEKHKEYLEIYHPFIDIVTTYDLLFNGIALQGSPEQLAKVHSLPFVESFHPVYTYEINDLLNNRTDISNTVLPADLHTSSFTGKGVKVGVIDTGIDYTHPDLAMNYVGGYDLVDLDDDPMETIEYNGEVSTIHGTHVAGIIAANGELQGVAPEASIYAYRALGPGGRGTTIQVIAALEQAVKDSVDIINMSLGNSINGPDYPTSVAVNRAVDHGVVVVIANGNDGPDNWTVGSPATATKALSVGASANSQTIPYLYERNKDKTVSLTLMVGSEPWDIMKTTRLVKTDHEAAEKRDAIHLIERSEKTFYEIAKQAEEEGAKAVLIMNRDEEELQGSIANGEDPVQIPVASVSKRDGQFFKDSLNKKDLYVDTIYKQLSEQIAPFSSRGPVTMNWDIKPDILAPGVNIVSTVPGGYVELNGTSMAAPHVAGAIAIMKEAHPDWSNEEIIGALKTTATQMELESGEVIHSTTQGMGKINLDQAIQAETIIDQPLLAFGKIDQFNEEKQLEIKIKNNTDKEQSYSFEIPKKTAGITWKLPQTFKLGPNEEQVLPIEITITTPILKDEIYQNSLTLKSKENIYHLPYMFINQTADFPKAMGFDFSLQHFDDQTYEYQLYVTEQVRNLTVRLYNPDTFIYERILLQTDEVQLGLNEGYIKKTISDKQGEYLAIITVQLEDGEYDSYMTDIYIE